MPRVSDDVLEELIANDGCRSGSTVPINSTGVVRLALDLQEARRRIADLELHLRASAATIQAIGRLSEDRANNTTGLDRGKRTKSRKKKKT